jgi:hypothetical protein
MHDAFGPVSSLLRFEDRLRAGQKEVHFMSEFVMLMIAGWIATIAMIGCFALSESGKLLEIRKRLASWRETLAAAKAAASDDRLKSADEKAA